MTEPPYQRALAQAKADLMAARARKAQALAVITDAEDQARHLCTVVMSLVALCGVDVEGDLAAAMAELDPRPRKPRRPVRVETSDAQDAIVAQLAHGPVLLRDLRKDLGLSRYQIEQRLLALVAAGHVEVLGTTKTRRAQRVSPAAPATPPPEGFCRPRDGIVEADALSRGGGRSRIRSRVAPSGAWRRRRRAGVPASGTTGPAQMRWRRPPAR